MSRVHRASVGNVELVALQDTWLRPKLTDFFPEAAGASLEPYRDLLTDADELSVSITPWLIRSAGRTILVDTGMGGRPVEAPLGVEPALPALLAEAGVPPEEIDVVAFTHLHFDHTGWNTVDRDGAPTPLFPNARHVVQQTEWDYWADGATGAEPDRARGLDPITAAGLWDVADGEQALTAGGRDGADAGAHAGPRRADGVERGRVGAADRRRGALAGAGGPARLVPRRRRRHAAGAPHAAGAVGSVGRGGAAAGDEPLPVPRPGPGRRGGRRASLGGGRGVGGGGRGGVDAARALRHVARERRSVMGANVRSRYAWVIAGGVGASLGKVIYDAVGDGIGVDTAIHVVIVAAIATGVALAVAFSASRRDGSRNKS